MHVTRSIRLTAVVLALLLAGTASASARTHQCVVPKLTGTTLKVARTRINAAGCKVGALHRPKGSGTLIVSKQSPKAKAHRKHDATVTLWLKVKPPKTGTTPTTDAPQVTYSVSVSAPVASATDPLTVTYTVTADAIEKEGATTTDLGAEGKLPAGILNLFSQGSLECAVNIGGSDASDSCTVTYPAAGTYEVEAQYFAMATESAQQTYQEMIGGVPTTLEGEAVFETDGQTQSDQQTSYFDIESTLTYSTSSQPLLYLVGMPITYTIIDLATGQTLATFTGTSNTPTLGCTVGESLDYPADTTETLTGESITPYAGATPLPACSIGTITFPFNDPVFLQASFAGNSTYAPSSSTGSGSAL